MINSSRTTGLIGITTQWIDESGRVADLAAKLGRLGEDVSEFAIHTMGWIRCTSIGAFEEYSFDARSVHTQALTTLLDRLVSDTTPSTTRLRCIEVTTARGTTKISDDRPDRMVSLVLKCMEIVNPRAPKDSIRRGRMDSSGIAALDDPVAARLIAAWKASGATLRAPILDLMTDPSINRGIKVMVPHGETFRLMRYHGSPNAPWDPATWRAFEGGTLDQVVPDRGMIESVKASTRTALAIREPLVEFCEGVILASQGLKEFQWYRISLPVDVPTNTAGFGDAGQGVLVLLSPVPQTRQAA
ncbi:hypothetical protein [Thalassobaculum salexigens]|uniref:hypothetical protein n=1 Tax=Thalassobaculum salexigens TaxID=455360 RepID=UPI0012EC3274|nr:hypothetical protein [Thalassobaculum salexigens]